MLSRAPLTLLVPLLLAAVPAAAQERPAASGTTFWGFVALGVGATDTDSTFHAAGVGGGMQLRRLVSWPRSGSCGDSTRPSG
ncbi:MAG: hypothetical protein ACRENB_08425 [Gemmatimonadales bacterium]